MDSEVIAAMARWPDVPDVYGWLSLSSQGAWRLHPRGHGWVVDRAGASGAADAAASANDASGADDVSLDPGEAITNPRILEFIGRNYAADAQGRWYFQNGPQRVYVRLDGAPWILRTDRDAERGLVLRTHTGQIYGPVLRWWLDEDGHLYAQADAGAGLVAGRDVGEVIDALHTPDGRALTALLEADIQAVPALQFGGTEPSPDDGRTADAAGKSPATTASLDRIPPGRLEATLGFVRRPLP
ncbi:DUF2946 family protein [Castellaniella sp. S9]|uniref:DUF2946 family protein n=1 Tax=Castellaniella sp. S9 TaxID=2993652 RepID=UPI0022B45CF9|nr:DUF2946 family protein [Castellaniella sp. S9]